MSDGERDETPISCTGSGRPVPRPRALKFDLKDYIGQAAFDALQAAFLDADSRDFEFQEAPGWHSERLQVKRHTNLRDYCPAIEAVACSPIIAGKAADLAGAEHMRLWMDETFIKVPGSNGTYWHQDLPY